MRAKPSILPRLTPLFLASLLVLVTACDRKPQPEPDSRWSFVDLPPDHPVMTTGSEIANELIATLLGRVTTEMQSGGPTAAIEVCRTEALELTDSVAESNPSVRSIKRTSERVRNPSNRPDPAEQLALDRFRQSLDNPDQTAGPLVQVSRDPAGGEVYRYHHPMFLAGACLQCHGSPAEIRPEVATLLREAYPDDRARGYRQGDWRGLIRVTIADDTL